MLPTSGTSKGQSIHINPDFKNGVLQKLQCTGTNLPFPSTTHINPNFMNPQKISTTIHMNPQFLSGKVLENEPGIFSKAIPRKEQKSLMPINTSETKITQLNKIISKSRTRIVRESHLHVKTQPQLKPSSNEQLLLLTKRKLIRAPASPSANKLSLTLSNQILKKKERLKIHPLTGIIPILKRRPCAFVARYALRRSNSTKKAALAISVESRNTNTQKQNKDPSISSMNKKLRLININGILYKSTGNKLQRKIESVASPKRSSHNKTDCFNTLQTSSKVREAISKSVKNPIGRTLYVRGAKYIMDPMGFKLTRVAQSNVSVQPSTSSKQVQLKTRSTSSPPRTLPRRIDIGGVTYIASGQAKNVFVRTSTHLVLAHLHHAKQRSVHVLSRSLTKTNKPCLIFQRLGKCAALERGRCSKVHDKHRIIVCPKFLQGLCFNSDCPLSHNKILEKMPVCRFFLQGSCVRNDCPYLHKKLRDDSEICEDFRRGYCALAEQCNKQHVFSKAKPKLNATQTSQVELSNSPDEATTSTNPIIYRYFNGESFVLGSSTGKETANSDTSMSVSEESAHLTEHKSDNKDSEENLVEQRNNEKSIGVNPRRKKLGALPAFIPLS